MRHKRNKWKLGRPSDQRVALVQNQVAALFAHGYINTTLQRAKAVQIVAERLITKAKRGDLTAIRESAKHLPVKQDLRNLLRQVAPAMADVPGGYTQIAKVHYRRGDGALIVRLALVGFKPEAQKAG